MVLVVLTTRLVCAEVAEDEPPEFVAVTTARSALPASPDCRAYELLVAPLIFTQLAPDESQSSHWKA